MSDDAFTRKLLKAHARMLEELDEESQFRPINTREREYEKGGIFVGVIECRADDERDRLLVRVPHAGVWIRGEHVKVLVPFYDAEKARITGVRLRPGDLKEPKHYLTGFMTHMLSPAVEVRAYLTGLRAG